MNKIRKDIFIGLLIGFAANLLGMLLYMLIFIDQNLHDIIYKVNQFSLFGKVISLGAALNFLPFFILLNKNKIYMARGVLIAMITAAFITLIYNFNIWFS